MDKLLRIQKELSKRKDDERVPYTDENGVMQIYTVGDLKKKLGLDKVPAAVPEPVKKAQAKKAAAKKATKKKT